MNPTMLPQLAQQLLEHAAEIGKLAEQIGWYVPENADRDDPIWEASRRAYGAKNECQRAANLIRRLQ